jgi:hypothetical protein|tara:strand:- start:5182 stop:5355 length:174 start_codon:yes stop_codon:yes gene_type:complete
MGKKKIDWRVVVCAMLCITVLEIVALLQGIDGVLLTTVIGVLAVIAGVVIPNPFAKA